jgi:hypothetical protein
MKYNIMTVINSDYFDFGKIFVNSFYDNINLDNVNKLYIYDTGLSLEDKTYLSEFPKLEIVSTELNTKHRLLHDEDWRKNVYAKTSFLLQVIQKDSLPTIMIDSDCLFISDFFSLISKDSDFIACHREEKEAFSEYIASFFVVNSIEKAISFIKDWRNEIFLGTESHKESPALTRLINKNKYNVSVLPEDLISYTGSRINDKVKIIHMKSSENYRTIDSRISQPHLKEYKNKYFTDSPLKTFKVNKNIEMLKPQRFIEEREKNKNFENFSPQVRALLLKRLREK